MEGTHTRDQAGIDILNDCSSASSGQAPPRCAVDGCDHFAVACHECVRAVALMFFGGIARHPEAGTSCLLCEAGEPLWCGGHFVMKMVDQRRMLRDQAGYTGDRAIRVGNDIGWRS